MYGFHIFMRFSLHKHDIHNINISISKIYFENGKGILDMSSSKPRCWKHRNACPPDCTRRRPSALSRRGLQGAREVGSRRSMDSAFAGLSALRRFFAPHSLSEWAPSLSYCVFSSRFQTCGNVLVCNIYRNNRSGGRWCPRGSCHRERRID